jgi:hypothetical protein
LDKNDHPDVHFIRPSVFIVRTTSSARFYAPDAILSTDGFLPRPHGRRKTKLKIFLFYFIFPSARTRLYTSVFLWGLEMQMGG